MSWGLGWKRSSESFRLSLSYGADDLNEDPIRSPSASPFGSPTSITSSACSSPSAVEDPELGFRIDLDWTAGDSEDQVALRLESQLMVALPAPNDTVVVEFNGEGEEVGVVMRVEKRREPLRAVTLMKAAGSGQQYDGVGVLTRLMRSDMMPAAIPAPAIDVASSCGEHWKTVTSLSLSGVGLLVMPVEVTELPLLEKLCLENNKLSVLPPEIGKLKNLKVLRVDNNMLISVPAELRQCVGLVELSLEHNKLIRPLLDFRAMAGLRILRLFGNPLEFLPEILPLHQLRQLSLVNVRIVSDENLRSVNVQIETENTSYFGASRHKLSAFSPLIFRSSSCHHPLLASTLVKIMQDEGNRSVIGKDENAVRQLISMITSDNRHVVEQACVALSSLARDVSVAMQLMKCDIMKPTETVLKSAAPDEVISVLQVVVTLAFVSDSVSQKMLTKDMLKSLKSLCAHKNPEVQRQALLAVGNLAFCLENRRILITSESLRALLMRLTVTPEPRVNKAAARALAILGENDILRRSIKGRQVPKQGLRILTMDGGGMKGLATVQILKEIEKGSGKRIHELFDLICGTSTGGMLAIALGVKLMTLEQCEEIYKNLGKLVFAEPVPKDNEAASWREKLDQLYKSSSQSFRVVIHGSKHSADEFERLLKEMCADEDGDLLIESAVKNVPKVFVVSTLVSVMPAQPFIFRNYQYSVGTPEMSYAFSDHSGGSTLTSSTASDQAGYYKQSAFMGSCKHQVWQAIRASSAAPYYLDDFSVDSYRWQDGAIVANNPTIFAIREAQLLWPDTKIDCLVSIGSGSVPTRVRKGGWRYLDTGQVLIESACSVERVEEALSTLLPMLPEIQYFRFNPVDDRCGMELDETDPAIWLKLEAAIDEYIQSNSQVLKNVCERLTLPFLNDEKWCENLKPRFMNGKQPNRRVESSPSLGWRRNVLLVEAQHSPDSGRVKHHARALESFCSSNGIKLSSLHATPGGPKPSPGTAFPTPFNSPLISGSLPTSPLLFTPDHGPQKFNRIDMVPPLSLDGGHAGKTILSPPSSPPPKRQLYLPLRQMHEKLQNLPQVGIIHLALQNDSNGSILSWQNDVFVVAEPGDLADKFLQSVKFSILSVMQSNRRKAASILSNICSISDLVRIKKCFQVGNIIHRYIGRQTQVMEDDQEIAAFMFRRTVPSTHLTPDDIRWMVGAWRDRIILYSGTFGPTQAVVKAFLDSGAKTVIGPSTEPQETPLITSQGSPFEYNIGENGKFEIGEEEDEEEEEAEREQMEPPTPTATSDWEDSDHEKMNGDDNKCSGLWEDEEEQVSEFVCQLYDMLFRENASVDVALQKALASHRKLRYTCHLANV
ncbi:PREDICTED: phospholipase A I isoform X1 [Brassica oleracea var. oleracea]|uniref:phospholipase A I isoform X1 n=1 Tax=Brassica oleracea var. oleracea TaxID=109376 RepID=UPI0006A6C8FD|nr:PREDICTED: phospholipase A I isoform X1 [Brassica oleracea var. oleracea]